MKINFYVDWTTLTWRFEIDFKKIMIQFFKKFFNFNDKIFVYALMCNSLNVKIALEMRKLFTFLKNYKNCFDFKNAEILFEHENKNYIINLLSSAKLSYESFYTFFKTEFEILKNYLLKNLTLNYIREFTSRASTLMFFILKKNNSFCLCINYKKLNAFIIKNKCSFFLIDETLNYLMSVVYFIKFNLKNAYHRIKIYKNNEWMTTFRIRYNYFKYAVMFFKLVNASVTFQTLINKILRELMNHICVIYLNNILIYFKTRKKHWKCMRKMLKRLRQFKLYAKLSKYFFMIQRIEFLEYIINNYDVTMNLNKIEVIQMWFELKNFRKL